MGSKQSQEKTHRIIASLLTNGNKKRLDCHQKTS